MFLDWLRCKITWFFFLLFPAPSKIGCTFPAWMQSKKSWSSIDSAFVWKFSGAAGNSTWRNNTKLATSENNFVNHEESQVWCHKIQEQLVEEEENDSDRIRSRRNHQKIILYATSGWWDFCLPQVVSFLERMLSRLMFCLWRSETI